MPVIVVAALLARDDDVAVYERGSFMPAWTPSHAERLLRSPDGFEIRRCRIDGLRRTVFTRLAETLRLSTGREPALLDVVRGLLRFVASLTPYARRTLRISQQARDIREALVRAREPAQLVFDELPAECGCPPFGLNQAEAPQRVDEFVEALEAGLGEIRNAYTALIDRACAVLAEQLSLPRAPADLAAELRTRARHLEDIVVDPMLKSFVLRASDEALAPDDLITSLLTQLASKPPHEWPTPMRITSRCEPRMWPERSVAPSRSWSPRTERTARRVWSDWRSRGVAIRNATVCFRCGPPMRLGLPRSATGSWILSGATARRLPPATTTRRSPRWPSPRNR